MLPVSVPPLRHNADYKFFNCYLKGGEKHYVNGVVFSPEKRHLVKEYSNDKIPVKINRYSNGNHFGSTSLVMNNKKISRMRQNQTLNLNKVTRMKSFPGEI